MIDEIQVTSPARMFINGETLTPENIDSGIEYELAELNKTNDSHVIDNAITTMIGLSKISIFSTAHLLYGYQNWWERTDQNNIKGDTFDDYIESVHGITPTTTRRYISIWHKRDAGLFPDEIINRPIKDQQAIADTIDQGYSISEEQWEMLKDAGNNTEILKILREIKGKSPTKASYVGYLERTGDIVYWHQDTRVHVGYLRLPEMAENDLERAVLEKAKARAVSGMGLIER